MRSLQALSFCVVALAGARGMAEDFLDRLDEALTVSTFHDTVRMRLSGLMDLEGYYVQQPAPGLIETTSDSLFNPRLTSFFDAQIGTRVYAFAQGRVDRGFDPSDSSARVRLDEYAIRVTPWDDGRLNLQVGKFGTVVGNWVQRHLSWENPFITAPLPYENITAIYDTEAPSSLGDFLGQTFETKYDYNPVIWGPSYATGASASGGVGRFDYAAEMKNASLASRPGSWDATVAGLDGPTCAGLLGVSLMIR